MAVDVRDRTHLRDILRNAGLSRAAAERVTSGGWPALDPKAGALSALARIEAATAAISQPGARLQSRVPASQARREQLLAESEGILDAAQGRDITDAELARIRTNHREAMSLR